MMTLFIKGKTMPSQSDLSPDFNSLDSNFPHNKQNHHVKTRFCHYLGYLCVY